MLIAPDAIEPIELIADEAAMVADEAASIAEVAADEAAIIDVVAASEAADIADEADIAGGVVVVVVVVDVSSFFEHAANETQAASVTISNAVFMLLLELKIIPLSAWTGRPRVEEPHRDQDKERLSISSA